MDFYCCKNCEFPYYECDFKLCRVCEYNQLCSYCAESIKKEQNLDYLICEDCLILSKNYLDNLDTENKKQILESDLEIIKQNWTAKLNHYMEKIKYMKMKIEKIEKLILERKELK